MLKGYEYREAQMKMAEAVVRALEERNTLLIEAATGTGKTWAYLVPAILSGKKVVISTGTKTLQDQLYYNDLPFLSRALSLPFNFSMMKGKSNYLCLHRFGQFQQQPSFEGFEAESHFGPLLQWSTTTKSGDRSELSDLPENSPIWQEVSVKGEACLGSGCPSYDRCYITRAKQEAAAADILIVNHHLFFADLVVKDFAFGEVLPHYDAVIFDEAHLLEDVATQYFGVSISSYRIEDFVRDAERELLFCQTQEKRSFDRCQDILNRSGRFFRFFHKGEERYRLVRKNFSQEVFSAGVALLQSLQMFRDQLGAMRLKSEGLLHLSERVDSLTADLTLFLDDQEDDAFILWAEARKHGVFLHASPLDVSTILRDRLFEREIPTVLTSATLSSCGSFDYVKGCLGIEEAAEMVLTSPFDYGEQALIYLPTHLPSPSHPHYLSAISEEILKILEVSRGRAFVLFTSWKNLEGVYQNLSGRVPYLLLKQGDQPKHALIEVFRREVSSVLFGTTSFWQGVDVQGEALSCVIIDRLPFASPSDPLVAARIESLAEEGKDPFLTYQVPSAILLLRQGIGRLIRNRQDRGLIAILDSRISKKGYGRYFLSSLPPSPRTSFLRDVSGFFIESKGRSMLPPGMPVPEAL